MIFFSLTFTYRCLVYTAQVNSPFLVYINWLLRWEGDYPGAIHLLVRKEDNGGFFRRNRFGNQGF